MKSTDLRIFFYSLKSIGLWLYDLQEIYGKKDPAKVAEVKALYNELNLKVG